VKRPVRLLVAATLGSAFASLCACSGTSSDAADPGAGDAGDAAVVSPACGTVPPGAPCCGDKVCGGPETPGSCPVDCATDGAPFPDGSLPPDGPLPDGPPPDSMPAACQSQLECDAPTGCPPGIKLGCKCVALDAGVKACLPRCATPSDCDLVPGMTLVCTAEGVCMRT
jgi:hypothetical protein